MGRGSRHGTAATQLGLDGTPAAAAIGVRRRAASPKAKRRQPKPPAPGQGDLLAQSGPAAATPVPAEPERPRAAPARRTKETAAPDWKPDGPNHRKIAGVVDLRVAILDGPFARQTLWVPPPLPVDIDLLGHRYQLGRRRDIGVVATLVTPPPADD